MYFCSLSESSGSILNAFPIASENRMTAKEHVDLLNSIQWADECSDTKLCQNDCRLPQGSLFLIFRIMVHVISHWFHSPSVCLCSKAWFSYTVCSAHRTSSSFRDANMLTAGTGVLTLSAHTTSFRAWRGYLKPLQPAATGGRKHHAWLLGYTDISSAWLK